MPCTSPLYANRVDGQVVFSGDAAAATLQLPCGQCGDCRLRRAREWATRCMHEAQLHDLNAFVTLTYRDPGPVSLCYRDFQLFVKRLRKRLKVPLKYLVCGEYGEETFRPHFHAVLFGVDFLDRKYHSRSRSGGRLYVSKLLDELWGHGHAWTGAVTFQSASYVARYVLKKVTGDQAEFYYTVWDPDSGELLPVEPEFLHMSLNPAIASGWLQKFGSGVYPSGEVPVLGKLQKAPRYYDKWFGELDPLGLEALLERRRVRAQRGDWKYEQTRKRLKVKADVTRARFSQFKREV